MDRPASPPSATFCSMLWKHICVRPNFTPMPCCRFKSQTSHHFATEASSELDINSSFFQDIRQKMLLGEKISGCEECYEEEKLAVKSLRMISNQQFRMPASPTIRADEGEIEYLEIFVGAKCNLKCVGCSPVLSSSIREEQRALNWKLPFIFEPTEDLNIDFIEKLTHLRKIKFVGGEPFLNKLHDSIIEVLKKRSLQNMELNYFTNCTIWPKPDTVEVWRKSKRVDITLSIDGIGDRNDYLRKNSRWKNIESHVHKYFSLAEKLKHVSLQINVTVSVLNMLYLQEVEEWFSGIASQYPHAYVEPIFLNYVTDPPGLAPHNAPAALARHVVEKFINSKYPQQVKVAQLLKASLNGLNSPQIFLDYVNTLDQIRGTSFRETFPELRTFFPASAVP